MASDGNKLVLILQFSLHRSIAVNCIVVPHSNGASDAYAPWKVSLPETGEHGEIARVVPGLVPAEWLRFRSGCAANEAAAGMKGGKKAKNAGWLHHGDFLASLLGIEGVIFSLLLGEFPNPTQADSNF